MWAPGYVWPSLGKELSFLFNGSLGSEALYVEKMQGIRQSAANFAASEALGRARETPGSQEPGLAVLKPQQVSKVKSR